MEKIQTPESLKFLSLRMVAAACLLGSLLIAAGCASPEVRAARSGLAKESRGNAPALTTYRDNTTGEESWTTHNGINTGLSTAYLRVTRLGLYYFPLNKTYLTTKTRNGFTVGRDGKFAYIEHPSINNKPSRLEIYGTTLKSIRLFRGGETNILSAGADVIYITRDGVFKASELGD